MAPKVTTQRYTKTAIVLHWLIAALLIGQIIGAKIMIAMDASAQKYELFQLHKSFGIVILILSLLRLLWRLGHRPPPLPKTMKAHETFAAKLAHIGFYSLMIGIPLMGWAVVSTSPIRITTKIFKTVKWPDLAFLERSEALSKVFENAHHYMSFALVLLLILHIAAALKHHFIDRDDVLTRMLPRTVQWRNRNK